jgi:NADH-quinone oxidoreductase subunit H
MIALSLFMIIIITLTSAYFTLAERKLMASVQRRVGPNVVGFWGILQPWSDAFKLALKENLIPSDVNVILYFLAPFLSLWLSFLGWAFIPFDYNNSIVDSDLGILFILMISSLSVYGIVFAGWSSNSKYALLGSFRTVAQMISYEISLGFCILIVVLFSGSLNFTEIVYQQNKIIWFCIPLLPVTAIFFCSILAETNRAPFDLPEAESELVAGYNVEYSSLFFAMFFLAEYSNIILMNTLFVIFFFGGWTLPFLNALSFIIFPTKIVTFCMFFVIVRASNPRYRFDSLIKLVWKDFLPILLAIFIFIMSFLKAFNGYSVDSTPYQNITDLKSLVFYSYTGYGS